MVLGRNKCAGAALAAMCVVLFADPASAQNCGRGLFNGFSIGVDAGMLRSAGKNSFDPPSSAFPASVPFETTNQTYGPLLGARLGYDVQCGASVFGVEADWSYSQLRDSNLYIDPFATPGFSDNQFTTRSALRSIGTVRGRLGWAVTPNWLFYGTGGLAYGDVSHSVAFRYGGVGQPDTFFASDNSIKLGWVAGAGLEYAFGNWSVRGEALFAKLGSTDLAFSLPPPFGAQPSQNARFDNAYLITRIGITNRF